MSLATTIIIYVDESGIDSRDDSGYGLVHPLATGSPDWVNATLASPTTLKEDKVFILLAVILTAEKLPNWLIWLLIINVLFVYLRVEEWLRLENCCTHQIVDKRLSLCCQKLLPTYRG
ncbi:hypothetical protein Cylst_1285 [Cylindrospermum stagnale PCC 7417]|uniref:Uncharacterized protein n=1 Tax=Cylindrospermum stagnale PCC 7417 TaxID=56107 RepID=K9WUY4_9NOST|nr:hypothetical protein [Cylindrospermum stagnale]AFZ23576.1 hypothetical protein Cylst_1285 [Cylindrospermum stagnale PCC 7417]